MFIVENGVFSLFRSSNYKGDNWDNPISVEKVQLNSAREAEKRWRSSSVEGIAGRRFWTGVGEGTA
jgi:hypothetical protein